jgi:hypothetical protein
MSILTWFRKFKEKRRLNRRLNQHLIKHGCITYCPQCKFPHFGAAEWIGDSYYVYECESCGKQAAFDFSYPVPVYCKDVNYGK